MRFDALRQSQIDAAEAECGFTDEEREVLAMARREKHPTSALYIKNPRMQAISTHSGILEMLQKDERG